MISERNIKTVVTWLFAGMAGLSSFYITRSLESKRVPSGQRCMQNWLDFTGEQEKAVLQSDPHFDTEAAELSLTFIQERQQLAHLLDTPISSNDQVMVQVEKVIGANHDLIKRVVEYILAVRGHLSPVQSQQLMRFCSDTIRGMGARGHLGGGGGYGQGRGSGHGPGSSGQGLSGQGSSGQGSSGQGSGRGQGRRRRQYGQLTHNIELDQEQMRIAGQLDPMFETDSAELAATVKTGHEQFALLLETASVSDNEIRQELENLLEARTQLEQRTARHVLLIRPYLLPEQQKVLVGLSAQCGRTPDD